MNGIPPRFDRDLNLAEALNGVPLARLQQAVASLIPGAWKIVNANGVVLLGNKDAVFDDAETTVIPLRLDVIVVGRLLATNAQRAQVELAGMWVQMLLAASARYRMAADIHVEAMHADFEALQRKHDELLQSEKRFRDLNQQLDQRVKSQVALIEQSQRRLYEAEKLASVGSLAAGMAHEINNPVGFIRSNLSTATRYVATLTQVVGALRRGVADVNQDDIDYVLNDFGVLLQESVSGADRIAEIVSDLKSFASTDSLPHGEVDMNEVLQSTMKMALDRLPPGLTAETALSPLPPVNGDRARLSQALFSIMQNARQALEGKAGGIFIRSRVCNGEICIEVKDNGCGIKPEVLGRIFDPFFTTRDVGKGTGLGLTVSRDAIVAHHGRIEARSIEGRGSIFTIYLPLDSMRRSEHEVTP